jgi:hypothetical protein
MQCGSSPPSDEVPSKKNIRSAHTISSSKFHFNATQPKSS